MPKPISRFLTLLILFIECKFNPANGQQISYQPLKDYPFQELKLDSGTALTILGFSGGKGKDSYNYYYSFFAINKETGDTIHILSSTISVTDPNDPKNEIFSPAYSYSSKKGVRDAIFEPLSDDQDLMRAVSFAIGKNQPDKIAMELNHKRREDYVAVNKKFPILQDPHYKTAIGTVRFKEIPWKN